MPKSEQLELPLALYPAREIMWQTAAEVRDWRRFGGKAVMLMAGGLQFRFTAANTINDHTDSDLRYALRFADAAAAMGSIYDSEFMSHSQRVDITATDEGTNSRLLAQHYTGTGSDGVDTFMEDIRSFALNRDENH